MDYAALRTDVDAKMLECLADVGVSARRITVALDVCATCASEEDAKRAVAFFGRVGLKNPRAEQSPRTGTWFASADR